MSCAWLLIRILAAFTFIASLSMMLSVMIGGADDSYRVRLAALLQLSSVSFANSSSSSLLMIFLM